MTGLAMRRVLKLLAVWLILTGCCFLFGVLPADAQPNPCLKCGNCQSCSCKMMYGWWSSSYDPPQGMMQYNASTGQMANFATNQGGAPDLASGCPDQPNRYQSSWDQAQIYQWGDGQAFFTCKAGTSQGALQEVSLTGTGTQLTNNMYYWYCGN